MLQILTDMALHLLTWRLRELYGNPRTVKETGYSLDIALEADIYLS